MKTIFNVDDLVRHKDSKKEMYIAKINANTDSNINSTATSGYYECTWVEFGASRNTFAIFHENDLEKVESNNHSSFSEE